jgi:hypothetical protein
MISKRFIAAAVLATLAVAVPATHAQTPGARTLNFTEQAKGTKVVFVDNGKHGPSAGDGIVLTIPLVDAAGAKLGTATATCTATSIPKSEEPPTLCQAVFPLADGDIVVSGRVTPGADHLAVVGGTGAYAGARGTMDSTDDKTGSHDVVTLLP